MSLNAQGMDRRSFLRASATGAAGLLIGFYFHSDAESLAAAVETKAGAPIVFNAWIHVGLDDNVTILIDKSEMGQSILTGLAMIAADELDCDWKKVRTEFAPADKVYFNPRFGVQGTGGSSGTPTSWNPLRKASATARAMLLQAAAQKWGVDVSQCRAENSTILHEPTKRRATYGSLAEAAAKLSVPQDVQLKTPDQYKLIGKPTPRLDTPLKVNGSAEYGIDVRLPGMLYAVVARCPVFGGKVASFDATKAKAVPGVKDAIQISSGIAVMADNTWSAMQGRRALEIQWDEGPNAKLTSADISKALEEGAAQPGHAARKEGDVESGLASAATKFVVDYEVPFLAHATMEPMNCTAQVRSDRCDVWSGTQAQTSSQNTAAKITGLDPSAVFIHTTFLGGGFGRRFESDFIGEAVEASKAMNAPVKVTWSREDDMQHDYYRMVSHARCTAGLDAEGWPVVWASHVSSPALMARFGPLKDNFDHRSVESLDDVPYTIPNILVDFSLVNTPIPIGFWRSVGASQNGFFLESFADELATAGKKDPYEFRRHLLAKSPRHLAVLQTAAENAGWGKPLPAGRARGIAVVTSYNGFVALVIEVSVNREERKLKVHRVVCALDCGRIVNPSSIQAQARSCIVYGLTAAQHSAITIDRGRVQQNNFNDYQMMRFDEMPEVEVHVVSSDGPPTGAGEFVVPPVAPALCNAIFAATGKRVRRLPVRPEDLA
ncbi:MAG TPA: xanthine dehydrogenase family protein molybdopterin-binding subunit [Candidatus Saccharimonadales bacterium]|jgi:isoquinoline 1-oxidoreductase beta subunit|nr:xanthine dehydrogenase family protein molybdopterin-binding subunit [Candidatus Saccharimonadales bacterium]